MKQNEVCFVTGSKTEADKVKRCHIRNC